MPKRIKTIARKTQTKTDNKKIEPDIKAGIPINQFEYFGKPKNFRTTPTESIHTGTIIFMTK